jgi:putative NADPH-quinone reductase
MEPNAKFSTLFIVAHPFLERSRASRAVSEAVRDAPGLTFRNLYDLYPYFHIDVDEEQRLMSKHDLIMIQHPLYWYSMPALLKQWLDEVWVSGWAYGPGGDVLRNKNFLLSVTSGGMQDDFALEGSQRYSLETLLSPWAQTVNLCRMKWHKPVVVHNSDRAKEDELHRHAAAIRTSLGRFAESGVWA